MYITQQSADAMLAVSRLRAELKRDIADAQRKVENLNHTISVAKLLLCQLEITAQSNKWSDAGI